MTAKHLLEGVMQHVKVRNHHQCSIALELDPATLSRIGKGRAHGMRIETLDHIQRKTEIPIETLFAWYRLPDGAHLGRIAPQS